MSESKGLAKRAARTVCPSCQDWRDDKRGRIIAFVTADGVTHFVPDMWLAGRSQALEKHQGLDPLEAYRRALGRWAEGCGLQKEFEVQNEHERKAV